jgi:hypothetical protein
MIDLAKTLILIGVVLVVLGLIVFGIQKLPFHGKIPGDLVVKRDNFTFFFPIGTSIILSILISLILYLINKFR